MMDGAKQELKVALNTDKEGEVALVQDKDEFKKDLPYTGYTLYAASELDTKLKHIQVQESLHLQHYSGRRLLTMKLSKNIQNMYGMMVKYRKKQLVQKKVQSYILV